MRKGTLVAFLLVIVGATIGVLGWYLTTPAPFSMQVTSRPTAPMGTEADTISLAGQRCVFLVVVADEGEGGGKGEAVDISATDTGRMVSVTVHPQAITPGQVAEVTVIPGVASINEILTITITGERYGLVQTESFTIEVIMGEDTLGPYAAEMRDMFIPWLATNHPELGITDETEWTGTVVNPRILVVMHYLFFSDDWEMYVTWHVTIQPHDWTRIYLRRRSTESRSSHAFEISSVKAQEEPHAIEVPDWV